MKYSNAACLLPAHRAGKSVMMTLQLCRNKWDWKEINQSLLCSLSVTDEDRKWVRTTGCLAAHLGRDTASGVIRLSVHSAASITHPEVNYSFRIKPYYQWQNNDLFYFSLKSKIVSTRAQPWLHLWRLPKLHPEQRAPFINQEKLISSTFNWALNFPQSESYFNHTSSAINHGAVKCDCNEYSVTYWGLSPRPVLSARLNYTLFGGSCGGAAPVCLAHPASSLQSLRKMTQEQVVKVPQYAEKSPCSSSAWVKSPLPALSLCGES